MEIFLFGGLLPVNFPSVDWPISSVTGFFLVFLFRSWVWFSAGQLIFLIVACHCLWQTFFLFFSPRCFWLTAMSFSLYFLTLSLGYQTPYVPSPLLRMDLSPLLPWGLLFIQPLLFAL